MSTHTLYLVPKLQDHIPSIHAQRSGEKAIRAMFAPEAFTVESVQYPTVQFFHCGEGMTAIRCPSCGALIDEGEWGEFMDADWDRDKGFRLSVRSLACCGTSVRLSELIYDGPCMFGRFAFRVTSYRAPLDHEQLQAVEREVGCALIAVYEHL